MTAHADIKVGSSSNVSKGKLVSYRKPSASGGAIAGLVAVVVLVVGYLITGWGHYVVVHNVVAIPHSWANTLAVLVVIVACGLAVAYAVSSSPKGSARVVAAIVAVALLLLGINLGRWANRSGYEGLHRYAANITVVDGALPDYDIRLNREQAKTLIDSQTGIPGDRSDPTFVPNMPGDRSGWCSLISRKFKGPINRVFSTGVSCLVVADDGTTSVKSGEFDKPIPSGTGSMSANMKGELTEIDTGLYLPSFEDDVYGYLDEQDRPYAVVPTLEWAGYRHAAKMPAKVVTYDPQGVRHSFDAVAAGDIPGPVSSPTIAAQVRSAVNTMNGFLGYRNLTGNDGAYQAVGNEETVLVRTSDKRVVYITALTRYGSGQLVTAYLEAEADTLVGRSAPKATLYRLPTPYTSLDAVAHTVSTLYDSDLSLNAADGYQLFELTPSKAGKLTATIGKGAASVYRVEVDAAQASGGVPTRVCLYPFTDDVPTPGTEIRCDTPVGGSYRPVPVGSIVGIGRSNSGPSNGESTVSTNGELDGFSDEETFAEAARRAQALADG